MVLIWKLGYRAFVKDVLNLLNVVTLHVLCPSHVPQLKTMCLTDKDDDFVRSKSMFVKLPWSLLMFLFQFFACLQHKCISSRVSFSCWHFRSEDNQRCSFSDRQVCNTPAGPGFQRINSA